MTNRRAFLLGALGIVASAKAVTSLPSHQILPARYMGSLDLMTPNQARAALGLPTIDDQLQQLWADHRLRPTQIMCSEEMAAELEKRLLEENERLESESDPKVRPASAFLQQTDDEDPHGQSRSPAQDDPAVGHDPGTHCA